MDIGKTGDKETTNADRRKKAGLPDGWCTSLINQ